MEIDKQEVLTIDLGKLPKDVNIDEFLKEFKESWREWSQVSMNEFIESKLKDAKI